LIVIESLLHLKRGKPRHLSPENGSDAATNRILSLLNGAVMDAGEETQRPPIRRDYGRANARKAGRSSDKKH
jgi:hypothetical protein